MKRSIGLLLTGLALTACFDGKDDGIEADEGSDPPGSSESDADTDADSDTDTDADTDADINFEPVAVGIALRSGYDKFGARLLPYVYDGDTSLNEPLITLSLADADYFSMTSDDPDRVNHFCNFFASYPHNVASTITVGYAFDYSSGTGPGGSTVTLDFFTEGYAEIFGYSYMTDDLGDPIYKDDILVPSATCQAAIDLGLMEKFDGMHLGVGFGDLTDYLREDLLEDFTGDYEDLDGKVNGSFIAINHPNSAAEGGYDFLPFDWNLTYYYAGELVEDVEITRGDKTTYLTDLIFTYVDKDGFLILGSEGDTGFTYASPYWFEDFPNLDLDILKEGAPTIDEK